MGVLLTLILIAVLLALLVVAYAVHVRQSGERHEETMAAIDALRDEIEREQADREAERHAPHTGSGTGRHHLAETTHRFPAVDYDDIPPEENA